MNYMDDLDSDESDYRIVGSGERRSKRREPVDRLSELPQSLIFHIFSFLSMRDIIKTSLLSKRWEKLWTTVPCIKFSDDSTEPCFETLREFVNRTLMFWKGNRILNFEICTYDYDTTFNPDVDLWVRFASENKAEELSVCLYYEEDDYEHRYMPPWRLYLCSSLRKLSLLGCNLRTKTPPAWNQLKILRLDSHDISNFIMKQILQGSPQLEVLDLILVQRKEKLDIRSKSLKKIKAKFLDFYYSQQEGMLSIQCPNLETFEISSVLYAKCLSLKAPSLTDAALWFFESENQEYGTQELLGETLRHVLSSIQHVERLGLSSYSLQVLGASQGQHLFSPLPNITFLKLQIVGCIEPGDIMNLLVVFPRLRKLVFEDYRDEEKGDDGKRYLAFETELANSFLLQQKTIEVSSDFYRDTSIFRFIEFLLKHDSMLEKLVIWVKERSMAKADLQRHLSAAETLLSIPRSSPNAKVIFRMKKYIFKILGPPPFSDCGAIIW